MVWLILITKNKHKKWNKVNPTKIFNLVKNNLSTNNKSKIAKNIIIASLLNRAPLKKIDLRIEDLLNPKSLGFSASYCFARLAKLVDKSNQKINLKEVSNNEEFKKLLLLNFEWEILKKQVSKDPLKIAMLLQHLQKTCNHINLIYEKYPYNTNPTIYKIAKKNLSNILKFIGLYTVNDF